MYISKRAAKYCKECWDKNNYSDNLDDFKCSCKNNIEANHMIRSNLAQMTKQSLALHNSMEENVSIPEWCQEKIAVATNMLDTVYDYLSYDMGFDMEKIEGLLENWSVPIDRD